VLGSAVSGEAAFSGGPSAKGSNLWILEGFHGDIFCKEAQH
jgi:hypothetical protein